MQAPNQTGSVNAQFRVVTPQGEGGISVIQVGGDDAGRLLDPLFVNPIGRSVSSLSPGALVYGTLQHHGELLDEVIICRRRVRPDLFEINCHGGIVPLIRVVTALKAQGIEDAQNQPALRLAGKPDLMLLPRPLDPDPAKRDEGLRDEVDEVRREAAERLACPAIAGPIAAKMLLDQLAGSPALRVAGLPAEALAKAGTLSAALQEIAASLKEGSHLVAAKDNLTRLLSTAPLGLALCSPPRIVIAGRPNVGKSTLFNRLLREERTLVDPAPGTTRDSIDHAVSIKHYPFILIDTAGIAASGNELGQLSGRRSRREIHSGDIVLLLIDRSRPLSEEDQQLIASVPRKRAIPVLTKSDFPRALEESEIDGSFDRQLVIISAQTGSGMDYLEESLLRAAFPMRWHKGLPVVFTERQRSLLASALELAETALSSPPDERREKSARVAARIEDCLFDSAKKRASPPKSSRECGTGRRRGRPTK